MSDAERRSVQAAEWAAEAKALGDEAAKSKALPSSKPGEPGAPVSGPAIPPILGSTVEASGSDDDEPTVWEVLTMRGSEAADQEVGGLSEAARRGRRKKGFVSMVGFAFHRIPCGRLCRYPHLSPGRKTGLPKRLRRPPGG